MDRKKSEWVFTEILNKAMGLLEPQSTDHLIGDLLTDEALRSWLNLCIDFVATLPPKIKK